MFAGVIPNYLAQKHLKDPQLLFETVCRQSHHFLDGFVKKDSTKLQFLESKPEQIGLRADLFTVEHRKPLAAPPRDSEIAEMVRSEGSIQRVRAIYEKVTKENPGVSVMREETLNQLGYEFLFRGNNALAIDIFKLNVDAFPKSANTYDSLAEAYAGAGKDRSRNRIFKKSVAIVLREIRLHEPRKAFIRKSAEDRLQKLENQAKQ